MASPISDLPSSGRLAYPFREFCRNAAIGLTTGYAEVRRGRLRVVWCGRRTLVLAEDAAAWLAALPEGTEAEPEPARQGRQARRQRANKLSAAYPRPSGDPPTGPKTSHSTSEPEPRL
jgi:hypothetical protein